MFEYEKNYGTGALYSLAEKAAAARMAWASLHRHHGRKGRHNRRGHGKGARRKGA